MQMFCGDGKAAPGGRGEAARDDELVGQEMMTKSCRKGVMQMELSLSDSDDTIEPELRWSAPRTSLRRMESGPAGSIHPHLQAGLTRSPD